MIKNMSVTGGVDYDSGPYTVTFPAGVTSVPFDVPIIDDDALEKRETFYIIIVRLSLPKGISCGTTCRSRVTIINDDCKWLVVVMKHWHSTHLCQCLDVGTCLVSK